MTDSDSHDGSSDFVRVDRELLEELVDTAKGDLERLVSVEGYREGDDVVDDLVETISEAEHSLDGGSE